MADTWTPRPGRRAMMDGADECFVDDVFAAFDAGQRNSLPARARVLFRYRGVAVVSLTRLTPPPEHRLAEAARNVSKWREAVTYAEPGSDTRNKAEAQLDYAIDALEIALEEYDA